MSKELNETSEMSEFIKLMLSRASLENNIRHWSLTFLSMSRIHLITNEEVERIYRKLSKIGRNGFDYGEISFYDDLERFAENITKHMTQNETKRSYHLPKCHKRDYANIETDKARLELYFDYTNFKRNPDIPFELLNLAMSKSRYCFASGSRETETFCHPKL